MRFCSAFFLAGLGDALTTGGALLLGFSEHNPFFVPFLATLIFLGAARFVDWRRLEVPGWFRVGVKGCLLVLAFSPVVWNLGVMFLAWLG